MTAGVEESTPFGYPAWAGIDPLPAMVGFVLPWLPRVGGDRPQPKARKRNQPSVTPRGRG